MQMTLHYPRSTSLQETNIVSVGCPTCLILSLLEHALGSHIVSHCHSRQPGQPSTSSLQGKLMSHAQMGNISRSLECLSTLPLECLSIPQPLGCLSNTI